jgi:hypothetical protein
MHEVIYGLLLWLWLKQKSIGMFARESLQGAMGKDVLYDTINRDLISKMLQLTEAMHLNGARWRWRPQEDVSEAYRAGSDG